MVPAPLVPVVPVLARRLREAEPLAPAQLLVVRLQPLVPAELEVPVEPLLSRQSSSAAMARSTT